MLLTVSNIGSWPARRWAVAVLASIAAGLLIGVPTGVVETSLYTRMTPVRWWDYPVWGIASVLTGLTVATYVRGLHELGSRPGGTGSTLGATLLSTFAVGCPICNKLVVGLVGVSGALDYWAPMQPVLGIASIGLLAFGLRLRVRGEMLCPVKGAG